MSERPPPHLLYRQAVTSHGSRGADAVSREYHRLLIEHGHLVPRPACTCGAVDAVSEHHQDCPRYQNNDQRLPCGWLPGPDKLTPLTLVVTGDRNWRHPLMLKLTLSAIAIAFLPNFELLVGDCPTGTDRTALDWARDNGWPHRVFHARWDQMAAEGLPRRAAGPLRNREMLDALQAAPGQHLVVAFHDRLDQSKGTRDCAHEAKRRDLPVYLVGKL
jgi:hypothetical protein